MIGAIAAGNTVVLKPSEYAPACADLMANLIPKYIEKHICQVFTGDVQFTQELLEKERFDYVFFTGGYEAGRAVYVAAAKHVTPVTLELGGKCPSYVDSRVSVEMAAKRIAFSKSFNAGQVCVSTDYVLCHKDIFEEFKRVLLDVYKEFYGENPQRTAKFSRIVNNRHFKRLTGMLANTKGKIILGGDSDAEDLFIAPTIVAYVSKDDALMREEIFGPILPIIVVDSATEAIEFINSRNKPLAIYVFTTDSNVFANFKHGTSSGAISQNDCCTHLLLTKTLHAIPNFTPLIVSQLPFGGVGHSGFGNYHGRFSLETFSHKRAVLLKAQTEVVNNKFLYPPYNEDKVSWARWLLSSSERSGCSIL
ncbi:unnamed protein product [Echinostoma caproni]|uniref:Aldedh domain-containing protein n=1 Tax=Echinostoma caproni TaxID=27848 RepID=A0A183ASS1_9TREM|nr:unnamed protein product [Echinostoma caproni]